MSLLVVYNTCGLSGRDNSDVYIKNLKSVLNQNLKDKKVVFSGCFTSPSTFRKVYEEFGKDISYCLTNKKLAVNQTFNLAVQKGVEQFGEFDGYMYVASDVTFSEDSDSLSKLHDRILNSENGIVSPEIDKDNGYFWWFDFEEEQNIWDVFGREKDFTVPLGGTANLHCKIFSNKIYKEYGNVLPDIFVSYCTESVFSFLTAAVEQKFIIANDVLYYHGENKGIHDGADGQTLAYGAAWDRLLPGAPRNIAEIVSDPEAVAVGFGYEEWVPRFLHKMDVPDDKPYLIHDEKQFDKNGFSVDDRLKNFIKKNLFLDSGVLNYNKIKHSYIKGA